MFGNKYLNYGVLLSLLIQMVVLITPFTRRIFKIELLNMQQIMVVFVSSVAILFAVEIAKKFRRTA